MKYFFKNSFRYVRKYIPVQVFALLLGLARILILLATPQIVSLLVDRVVNPLLGEPPAQTASIFEFLIAGIPADDYVKIFWVLSSALLLFALLFFVCFYAKWNLAHYFSLKSEKAMRTEVLDKINRASAPMLMRYSAGDLILIGTKDPHKVCLLYDSTFQFLLDSLVYIVFSSVLLCKIDPLLIALPIAGGVLNIIVVLCYRKRVTKHFEDVWHDSAVLSTTVQESVYGVRTVASFAREEERKKLFARNNGTLYDTNVKGVRMFSRRNLWMQCIRSLISVGEVALAVWMGIRGLITPGDFTAVVAYVGMLMWQITDLLFCFNDAQDILVSAKRLFGFLNDRDETAERYGDAAPSATPSVEFRNVGVKCGEGYALQGIDLTLPYGKRLGVMGRTGGGKTLLCKLMQGLAEADEGEILIDGRPIHDYDRGELLRAYSYAMHNVFLFSNTISANIALYDPFADEEKIERAGALAEADEFARRFPDGYLTTIGEKGFGLSGGQKQRISIARALFKNAQILVFDDVTSALDMDTERRVFANIDRECGEKTLVLVTHRATALKNCDEIVFLENGRITERGTFAELMALNGNFAKIYASQISETISDEGGYAE